MNTKIIGRRELRLCSGCASNYSRSAPKSVLSEVDNLVPKSNIQRSGRSFASSIPSRLVEPQKSYKRISKDVRQTMVESFVKEYQSLNEGKFPTASQTKKQVGGSYYVLRSILLELERKYMALHPKHNEIAREKKPYKESECLVLTADESISTMSVKEDTEITSSVETIEDAESGVNCGDKHLKAISRPRNSTEVERALPALEPTPRVSGSNFTPLDHVQKRKNKKASSHTPSKSNDSTLERILDNDVAASIDRPRENEKLSHLPPKIMEDNKATEPVKDSAMFEHTKNENGQPNVSLNAAEFARSRESDLSKNSTLWGNLKSFADGIINLWRKR